MWFIQIYFNVSKTIKLKLGPWKYYYVKDMNMVKIPRYKKIMKT